MYTQEIITSMALHANMHPDMQCLNICDKTFIAYKYKI